MRWLPLVAVGIARVKACGAGAPDAASAPTEEHGKLGILVGTSPDGAGVQVAGLAVTSAATGRVCVGDRIVAIDGAVVRGSSQEEVRDFVRRAEGAPGTSVELTVERSSPAVRHVVRVPRVALREGVAVERTRGWGGCDDGADAVWAPSCADDAPAWRP